MTSYKEKINAFGQWVYEYYLKVYYAIRVKVLQKIKRDEQTIEWYIVSLT